MDFELEEYDYLDDYEEYQELEESDDFEDVLDGQEENASEGFNHVNPILEGETGKSISFTSQNSVPLSDEFTESDVLESNKQKDKELERVEKSEKILALALEEMGKIAEEKFKGEIFIQVRQGATLSQFQINAIERLTKFSFVEGALKGVEDAVYQKYVNEVNKRSFDIYFELVGVGKTKHVGKLLPTQLRVFMDKVKGFDLRLTINGEPESLDYLLAYEVL